MKMKMQQKQSAPKYAQSITKTTATTTARRYAVAVALAHRHHVDINLQVTERGASSSLSEPAPDSSEPPVYFPPTRVNSLRVQTHLYNYLSEMDKYSCERDGLSHDDMVLNWVGDSLHYEHDDIAVWMLAANPSDLLNALDAMFPWAGEDEDEDGDTMHSTAFADLARKDVQRVVMVLATGAEDSDQLASDIHTRLTVMQGLTGLNGTVECEIMSWEEALALTARKENEARTFDACDKDDFPPFSDEKAK